jgi:uncharacterized surface protein with fasciclin (FAS1) repeats
MKSKLETVVELKDIIGAARETGVFKIFLAAVERAGLEGFLKNPDQPLTIFAPVDRAFEKIPKDTLEKLLHNKKELVETLLYHCVPGKLAIGAIMGLTEAGTLQGGKIRISVCDGLSINQALVIKADVDASNGIIHGIDTLLMPRK